MSNEALQTTAASHRVIERSECMLILFGLSAAVSELGRWAKSGPLCARFSMNP